MEKIGVLFVCLGNICRSPSAQGIFEQRVQAAGLADRFLIDSCGTARFNVGRPPDPRAIAAAQARGYDISRQVARQIDDEDYRLHRHILVMDHVNMTNVKAWAPKGYTGQIELFLRFGEGRGHTEIPDPYKESADAFGPMMELLESSADGLLAHLRKTYAL